MTNPPIDPIREELVMSRRCPSSARSRTCSTSDINPPIRLEVSQPVLSFDDIQKVRHIEKLHRRQVPLARTGHLLSGRLGQEGVEARLASLVSHAEDAVRSGANILIISDRKLDADSVAIPALLATSAVTSILVKEGSAHLDRSRRRNRLCREVHHFALLGGLRRRSRASLPGARNAARARHGDAEKTAEKFVKNFIKAIGKGLCKVMSKMGISTYMSYTGAQIFEAIGLKKDFVEKYFTGTPSNIEGHRRLRGCRGSHPHARKAFGADPVLADMLDAGGESTPTAFARRRPHVDPGRHRQAAARHALR